VLEFQVFDDICRALVRERHPVIYERGRTELFSEWFRDNLSFQSVDVHTGRHPDIVIVEPNAIEGYELKSARSRSAGVQYNSTPPCGTMPHGSGTIPCFYVFADYQVPRGQGHGYLQDLVIVDGDYINNDYSIVLQHGTHYTRDFGSYGDGRIRHRRMYHFPNPMKDLPAGVYLVSKIVGGQAQFPNIALVQSVTRKDKQGVDHTFCLYTNTLLTP
jgi:hypothetical protein